MANRDIVVIGGSAGAIEALKSVVAGIPPEISAAVFVVVHVSADWKQLLPSILENAGRLPARLAQNGAPLQRGVIHVAPSDEHLLLEANHMRVLRGPKENNHRPAIDPLFRSAAWTFGARVVGVVLSGTLDDGAAGLWSVNAAGGTTVVQSPADATFPEMPLNALREMDADYQVPAKEIGPLLNRLASEPAVPVHVPSAREAQQMVKEASTQMHDHDLSGNGIGKLSAFTCPGCGGALWELDEGVLRYRCHVSHAFTAESLLSERTEAVERTLYAALRALKEKAALSQRIANRLGERHSDLAAKHRAAGEEATRQAFALGQLLSHGNA
jgi:two-component system chemotaxis response regulator CheB